ncbi:MAG: MipA/OmpV family protein, partial [Pseudomonadota bacterium]
QLRNWVVGAKLGAAFLSGKTSDYYFGVAPGEATTQLPAYNADASAAYSLALRAEYPMSERWTFEAQTSTTRFSDEIDDSPITQDNLISVATLGFKYNF